MYQYVVNPSNWFTITPVFCGTDDCAPGQSFGPAVRSYCLIHYVLDGEGWIHKNNQIYSVQKGDMFVILPTEVTTYRASKTNPWKYVWLAFCADPIPDFLSETVLRQKPVKQIFSQIRENCTAEIPYDGKLYALTHELLWILSDKDVISRKNRDYALFTKTYLENTYMNRVRIQDIADSTHIDRRYLTSVFQKVYGVSPKRFLMDLRLDKAQEFLSLGYSVTESAVMAGFTDLPNFSRQYKARFGCSPGALKNVNRKKLP